jgi:hypothetical protein
MAVAQEIKDLKELLDSGILTEEEFEKQKSGLLSGTAKTEPAQAAMPTINIVNTNTNTNTNQNGMGFAFPQRSKLVALLLCIFLGYWGGHCFYCGKAGMGILYIFTFGLFGIGWFVDIIRIAVGSYRDVHGIPLK